MERRFGTGIVLEDVVLYFGSNFSIGSESLSGKIQEADPATGSAIVRSPCFKWVAETLTRPRKQMGQFWDRRLVKNAECFKLSIH